MYEGKTLLHVAAAEGRVATTRVLLEYKADLNARVRCIPPLLLGVRTQTHVD